MPVFTFSTKATKPKDTELVQRMKDDCEKKRMSFSGLIVQLLEKHEAEQKETKKA